jgi:hypothetical protein
MSITEPSPGTTSASPGSSVPEQAAPPPVVRGEPAEVADGVLVIPDGRVPLVPNVGFVVGDHAVLVIDTGVGRRNGAYVLEHARRLAGGRPVYLTTTHFHPEHSFGAQVFKGEATIIYNHQQRDELHRKGAAYIEMFRGLGPDIAAQIADVELTDPDVTYDGQAEIDLGGHQAVLHSWGPAHTAGDQTILVDGCGLPGRLSAGPARPTCAPPRDTCHFRRNRGVSRQAVRRATPAAVTIRRRVARGGLPGPVCGCARRWRRRHVGPRRGLR